MRKLLAGFLTGVMALEVLAFPVCAADADLSFFTGKVETVDLMDEIIADFNAQNDGITVEQEYQNDASNIIKIKFASGEAPDIMTTYEQEYVDQGKYLDLSDMNDIWDRLIPSMKESCTDVNSGKQYRICTNMTMAGFFYNKEIFDELDLAPADTWETFVANLETIKTEMPEVAPWFIFGSEAWHLGHLIEFIPHGYIKAKYGATETKKAMLNNDKSILNFGAADGAMATFAAGLLELQEKGLINEDVLTATSDNCVDAFVSGEAAMFSNGMWCLSNILEKDPEMADKIGFAPYPSMMEDGTPMVLVAEDSGYSISADSEHQEEAKAFLEYLFSAENQTKYAESLGSPSAFTDVDAKWAPETVVEGVNAAVESAANIGFTNEKPAGFSGDDAGRMVQDLLAGKYTAEEFAAAYEKAWDAGF
ncbi:ABC transporter substrate-binding protein [Ruminococcus sp. 5_1_39BFAA]|uniref:ABC transporter substrate-binding protein n=1 Tax=Ruminococcus sp. 5_1_39BFAA TaxID=457412 RepID=UPI003566B6F8